MMCADRTGVSLSAEEYGPWAMMIVRDVAVRTERLRGLIVWQMRQSLHLRIWSATTGKRVCTGLATICFGIHRHIFLRGIVFRRWAFACLSAAQRCRLAAAHWRRGVEVLRISSFSLSVQPREVCFHDRV
ncbi:MAG: hypothetical protein WCD42_07285 [Rhizomicrobium sp.]